MGKLVTKDSKRTKCSPKSSKICTICGKSFVGFSSNQKTCSPECSKLHQYRTQRKRQEAKSGMRKGYSDQKGKNNNYFKGNGKLHRRPWIYSKYRKDYCEYCGIKNLETKLTFVVHHRYGNPTNDIPDNLVTLCHSCHKLVHNGKIIV